VTFIGQLLGDTGGHTQQRRQQPAGQHYAVTALYLDTLAAVKIHQNSIHIPIVFILFPFLLLLLLLWKERSTRVRWTVNGGYYLSVLTVKWRATPRDVNTQVQGQLLGT